MSIFITSDCKFHVPSDSKLLLKVNAYTLSRNHSYSLDPAIQIVSIIHSLLWLPCNLHILANQILDRPCIDLYSWFLNIFLHFSTPVILCLLIALLWSCLLLIRLILIIEVLILNKVSDFFFPQPTALTDDTNVFHIQSCYPNLAFPPNFNYTGFDAIYNLRITVFQLWMIRARWDIKAFWNDCLLQIQGFYPVASEEVLSHIFNQLQCYLILLILLLHCVSLISEPFLFSGVTF